MHEAFTQAFDNLRANTLRSFLTMFGILWGIVSIVVLSALGEGFRRGNDAVLREEAPGWPPVAIRYISGKVSAL